MSKPTRTKGRQPAHDGIRSLVSDEDRTQLRMTLGRLGRLLRQQNPEGLSYALVSLLFTIGRTQPITAGDLALAEGVSPPAVTRSLTRLVQLGLATRVPNPADKRAAEIRLTEAGERERTLILQSREVWLTEHLQRISEEDIRIILAALPALDRLVKTDLNSDGDAEH